MRKPEALTALSLSEVKKYKLHENRYLLPAGGGLLTPAEGGQDSGFCKKTLKLKMHLKTIVIGPNADDSTGYLTRPKIRHNNKTCRVALDQITTFGKQQMLKVVGDLQGPEIKRVKSILKETYID